jgi:hypothetical protein
MTPLEPEIPTMRTSSQLPCSLLEFLADADRTAAMVDRDGDRLAASSGGVIHRGMAQELRVRVARVRALEATRDRSRGPSSTELRPCPVRGVAATAIALSLRGWAAFARERLGGVGGVDPAGLEALADALDAHRAEAKASAAARRATLEQRARWVAELADRVATIRAAERWDRIGRCA